jgi:membrane-associated phospholipid phosphatase
MSIDTFSNIMKSIDDNVNFITKMKTFDNWGDNIGYYGPIINFVIGFVCLIKQPIYLYSYLVFTSINTIINTILKNTIKEPRPNNEPESYGMPSLHAQGIFFVTAYLYFVQGSIMVLLFELFISCLTLYQRWKYKKHTLEQLLVGSLLGIIIAYISVTITEKYLTN